MDFIYEKGSRDDNKFRLPILPPPPYFEVVQYKEDEFIKNPLEVKSELLNEFRYRHGYVMFAFENNKPIKIGGNYDSGG